MTDKKHHLHLLSTAAGLLGDTSHLLAAAERDKPYLPVLDAPGFAFYETRLRIVQRAHAAAVRVVGALLSGDSPGFPDVLAVAHHAALFAHWFGERPTPAGAPLNPTDA